MNFKFTLAPIALLILGGCVSKTETPVATAPQPVEATTTAKPTPNITPLNAPGVQTEAKRYRVRGSVTGIEKSAADGRMTLIVKHENIPNFMPAMEMRFPFAVNADAEKVKVDDKIAFDMNADNMEVSNLEALPASTQLKLAK